MRESFRDQGRVRKRTLANLSGWPIALVEGFRTLLKGGVAVAADGIRIRRALPHGHAAAVLGTIRAIGLDRLLGKPSDKRLVPLALALIASRLVSPASKLATARDLAADTAASSLGRLLLTKLADQIARGAGRKDQDKIARAVGRIENRYKLAKLFDITVAEDGFSFARNPDRIAAEARLDGFYVIRTSVETGTLAGEGVVGAYKGLARVERAFRT